MARRSWLARIFSRLAGPRPDPQRDPDEERFLTAQLNWELEQSYRRRPVPWLSPRQREGSH